MKRSHILSLTFLSLCLFVVPRYFFTSGTSPCSQTMIEGNPKERIEDLRWKKHRTKKEDAELKCLLTKQYFYTVPFPEWTDDTGTNIKLFMDWFRVILYRLLRKRNNMPKRGTYPNILFERYVKKRTDKLLSPYREEK